MAVHSQNRSAVTDIERKFYLWCVDMRLQGVHPDWFPIWCGANRNLKILVEDAQSRWPMDAHFKAPDLVANHFGIRIHFEKGLPRWERIKQEVECDGWNSIEEKPHEDENL